MRKVIRILFASKLNCLLAIRCDNAYDLPVLIANAKADALLQKVMFNQQRASQPLITFL